MLTCVALSISISLSRPSPRAPRCEERECAKPKVCLLTCLLANQTFGQHTLLPKEREKFDLLVRSSRITRTDGWRWRLRSRTMQIKRFLKFNFFLPFFLSFWSFKLNIFVILHIMRVRQYLFTVPFCLTLDFLLIFIFLSNRDETEQAKKRQKC